jgi:hypothetical protein
LGEIWRRGQSFFLSASCTCPFAAKSWSRMLKERT